MTEREPLVLWREGASRCEFARGVRGQGRLAVYLGDALVTAEATPSREAAVQRAEILRLRVLRGDLVAPNC